MVSLLRHKMPLRFTILICYLIYVSLHQETNFSFSFVIYFWVVVMMVVVGFVHITYKNMFLLSWHPHAHLQAHIEYTVVAASLWSSISHSYLGSAYLHRNWHSITCSIDFIQIRSTLLDRCNFWQKIMLWCGLHKHSDVIHGIKITKSLIDTGSVCIDCYGVEAYYLVSTVTNLTPSHT